MALTSVDSGQQTATLTEEHTLATETAAGVYVLVVDTNALVGGETVTLKIKTKAKDGSTSRVAFEGVYANVQADPNKYSPPVPIDTEIVCTLTQVGGTGRAFDWNLLKVG